MSGKVYAASLQSQDDLDVIRMQFVMDQLQARHVKMRKQLDFYLFLNARLETD